MLEFKDLSRGEESQAKFDDEGTLEDDLLQSEKYDD